jgi:hypothetical protein
MGNPIRPIQPSPFFEEAYTPEACGWVFSHSYGEYRVYEKPNGDFYTFGPGQPELIYKLEEV